MKEVYTYTPHKQQGIMLDANELYQNLNPAIIAEVQALLPQLLFNRYPDDTCSDLKKAYAAHIGKEPSYILCGNGSDQMLGLLIGTFLSHDKKLLTLTPDFGMYDYYASSYEAGIEKYEIKPGEPFDMADFIAKAEEVKPDLILFSNPNNPTGNMISQAQIKELLAAFPATPIVVDEAYMDFADQSMLPFIDEYPNLYVTRTLSKAYGLAGLRVGFLVSQPANIADLDAKKVVYSVNTFSQAIGSLVLSHADEYEPVIQAIQQARDELISELQNYEKLTAYPSAANFVLVAADEIEKLEQAFANQQINIRTYPGRGYVRITLGSQAENEAVKDVLRKFEEAK